MANSKRVDALLHPHLEDTIGRLVDNFRAISPERKQILHDFAGFVTEKARKSEEVKLVFICTHNSRRSHISQIWAQTAAVYFGVENVYTYSGGTEESAFNARAVRAMREAGFTINARSNGGNPRYEIIISSNSPALWVYSKKYNCEANPTQGFAAILTCSHADLNCPIISGAEKRISLPYDDPKEFDGTSSEEIMSSEKVNEIGTDILYAFSKVKSGGE